MPPAFIPIEATVLSPFHYHGLYQPDGSTTIADWLSDTSLVFALAHAWGLAPTPFPRITPAYRADLSCIPWRASLLQGCTSAAPKDGTRTYPRLLPVSRRAILVEREGDYPQNLIDSMNKGPFKRSWFVQEVAPGSTYQGILVGPDPFAGQPTLCVRIGVGRQGLLQLTRMETAPEQVHLNAAMLQLFGVSVSEQVRLLDTLRISVPLPARTAADLLTRTLSEARRS